MLRIQILTYLKDTYSTTPFIYTYDRVNKYNTLAVSKVVMCECSRRSATQHWNLWADKT